MVYVCDLSGLDSADAALLDALLRLQLIARRGGDEIRFRDPPPQLVELIALLDLGHVLAGGV
jgi:anti-anti-sigma regulatory factor